MGSGNTKVQKINKPPCSPAKKEDKKKSQEGSTTLNHKSNGIISPNFSKSTINPDRQDPVNWVPPGMVEENESGKSSLITSEALIMGKKKLKASPQSNNNSNIPIENDSQSNRTKISEHRNNKPFPKPRRNINHSISTFQSFANKEGYQRESTSPTDFNFNSVSLCHPQVQESAISNVDQMTSTFDCDKDFLNRHQVDLFDTENMAIKRPLPAPRFSKRNSKKQLFPPKHVKQTVQKPLKFVEKEERNVSKFTATKAFFVFPIYDQFEINLMEEIEREFGIRNV